LSLTIDYARHRYDNRSVDHEGIKREIAREVKFDPRQTVRFSTSRFSTEQLFTIPGRVSDRIEGNQDSTTGDSLPWSNRDSLETGIPDTGQVQLRKSSPNLDEQSWGLMCVQIEMALSSLT
jgi:hypothetical protein